MANKFIKNYILNISNTILGMLLPIVTFPYITEVLGADNLGIVNWANSFGYYFNHLASFGISSYAVREIARVRDDPEKATKVANEIFNLNIIFSLVAGIAYMAGVFIVPDIRPHALVFSMYAISLFTNFLGLGWVLQANDDYLFSTIRGIILRVLAFAATFIFVKESEDYPIYMLILTISDMGTRLSDLWYCRKNYVKVRIHPKFLNFKTHIKSLFTLFTYRLVNGISSKLDQLMIGFMISIGSVAIYNAGEKFVFLIIPFVEYIGVVLFPKITISADMSKDEYKRNVDLNYSLILMLSIPMAVGMYLTAPMIIRLFTTEEFKEASNVMRIMTLIIVLCPVGDLLGSKILLVFNKDRYLLICSTVVAFSNIILNCIFLPLWGMNGATIASVISYFVAVAVRYYYCRKVSDFSLFNWKLVKYFLFTVPFIVIYVFFSDKIDTLNLWGFGFIAVSVLIYVAELYLSKDEYFMLVLKKLLKKGN